MRVGFGGATARGRAEAEGLGSPMNGGGGRQQRLAAYPRLGTQRVLCFQCWDELARYGARAFRSDYLRIFDLPSGLLAKAGREPLQLTVGWLNGEPVTSALTFDLAGACGIYNVGTLDHLRRRGLATLLTTHLLHQAQMRGCTVPGICAAANRQRRT
jgi:hypothetical protein